MPGEERALRASQSFFAKMCGAALPPEQTKRCGDRHEEGRLAKKRKCSDRRLDLTRTRAEDELDALDERGGRHGLKCVLEIRAALDEGATDDVITDGVRVIRNAIRSKSGAVEAARKLYKKELEKAAAYHSGQRDESDRQQQALAVENASVAGELRAVEAQLAVEKQRVYGLKTQLDTVLAAKNAAEEAKEGLIAEQRTRLAEMDKISANLSTALARTEKQEETEKKRTAAVEEEKETIRRASREVLVETVRDGCADMGKQVEERMRTAAEAAFTASVSTSREREIKESARNKAESESFKEWREQTEKALCAQADNKVMAANEELQEANTQLAIQRRNVAELQELKIRDKVSIASGNAALGRLRQEKEAMQKELERTKASEAALREAEQARQLQEARRAGVSAVIGRDLEKTFVEHVEKQRPERQVYALDTHCWQQQESKKPGVRGPLGYHDVVLSCVPIEPFVGPDGHRACRPVAGAAPCDRNDRRIGIELKNVSKPLSTSEFGKFMQSARASVRAGGRGGHCFLLACKSAVSDMPPSNHTWEEVLDDGADAEAEAGAAAAAAAASGGAPVAPHRRRFLVTVMSNVPVDSAEGLERVLCKAEETLRRQMAEVDVPDARVPATAVADAAAVEVRAMQRRREREEELRRLLSRVDREAVRQAGALVDSAWQQAVEGVLGAIAASGASLSPKQPDARGDGGTGGTSLLASVDPSGAAAWNAAVAWLRATDPTAQFRMDAVPEQLRTPIAVDSRTFVKGLLQKYGLASGGCGSAAAAEPAVAAKANSMYSYMRSTATGSGAR